MTLLLYAYLFIVLLFLIYSAAAIYHLIRYGYSGDLSKLIAIVYIVVAAVIISVTLLILIPLTIVG